MSFNVSNLAGQLNNGTLGHLIDELASGLRDPKDVWHEAGITTRHEAERILSLDVVQEMLREARARWHSSGNAKTRIRHQSLMAVEEALLPLYRACTDDSKALNHRIEGLKLLSKWAGLEQEQPTGGGMANGVSITIDLSGGDGRGAVHVIDGQASRAQEAEEALDDPYEEGEVELIDEGEAEFAILNLLGQEEPAPHTPAEPETEDA